MSSLSDKLRVSVKTNRSNNRPNNRPKHDMKIIKSPRKDSYSRYLKGKPRDVQEVPATEQKTVSLKPKPKEKSPDIKIIRRPEGKRKSKHKLKRHSAHMKGFNDINEIEAAIRNLKVKPQEKPQVKPQVKPKSAPRSRKRSKHRSTHRSTQRQDNRHQKDVRKHRNVSVKKRQIKPEDVARIEKKIQSIRNKKSEDIRSELAKDGIKVSGKSNRLLKDIYFYSKVCNINIKHD